MCAFLSLKTAADPLLFRQGDIRKNARGWGRLLHMGDQGPEVDALIEAARGLCGS